MLVILMFVACLLVDLLCFVAYHLRISRCLCAVTFQSYASSCLIELVAQRQHPASFMFSRSNLLWFALILGVSFKAVSLARTTDLSFYSDGLWRVVGKAASRRDRPSGSN